MSYAQATALRAEMEGYRAGLAAHGISACPYALNTAEWHAWMKGYRTAYAKA